VRVSVETGACGPPAGGSVTAVPLGEAVDVDVGDGLGVLLPAGAGAGDVLVATAAKKRREVSSVLVTVPLMMSDAITPGLW
jgi:hypothetical protein